MTSTLAKPSPNSFAQFWQLDPEVVFLNHGSFGSCPKAVLQYQQSLRDRMEAEPIQFLDRQGFDILRQAREALARFVGADPEGVAFVTNATTGVNTVLSNLEFKPGDELLVTDHAYNACKNALHYRAARDGAKLVVVPVPFPVSGPDVIIERILSAVTSKTRFAMLDHITSPTALVLPVALLVKELQARGIDTLVDGAHAPGMLPLNLTELGAAYYTGNCHKWLCAPKGAGFLYVRADRREGLHPLVISHGYNSMEEYGTPFRREFDWTGTYDPTPYFAVSKSIQHLGTLLPGGWEELMARNHALALKGRNILAEALGCDVPCPVELLGSMVTMPLPMTDKPVDRFGNDPLSNALYDEFRIEIPVIRWPQPEWKRYIRISAQLYNAPEQYEYLVQALAVLLKKEKGA